MKHGTNTTIVVPNWNGKAFLGDCLESLKKQSHRAHIIVVDNGSEDGSKELIAKKFPEIEIIALKKNHGFAGAVNYGIRKSLHDKATYVALFNNDATADKHWLAELVAAMESKPSVGIVTGKLLKTDGKHFDSTGEQVAPSGMPRPRGRDKTDTGQYNRAEYVFAASGGASLYRAALLEAIGLFDEDFFAYYEDVDISFRAQLAGWKVWYQPTARAYHRIGQTSGRLGSFTRYHSIKNFILLYNKNMPGNLFWGYKPLFLWQLLRMFGGALRDGQVWAYGKAVLQALLLMPRTLSKRSHIQKSRKVSPEYIDTMLAHRPITRDLYG